MNALRRAGIKAHLFFLAALTCLAGGSGSAWAQMESPNFTRAQAAQGQSAFDEHCATCHGPNLGDGVYGPALEGAGFVQKWGGKSLGELFARTFFTMPPAEPGSLSHETYVEILAYVLQKNGVHEGPEKLPTDPAALGKIVIPATGPTPSGGIAGGIPLPPPPDQATNRLQGISPVTEAMLADPPGGDWLTWRRNSAGTGFSPLGQIAKENVRNLRVAWSWALPDGPSQVTPLVHDGVIFVQGWGDGVQALDAVSGELLWQYTRWLPGNIDSMQYGKRSIGIFGNFVFLGTSDAHVVALDMKSGQVGWDRTVGDPARGLNLTGGPLIARGKVMVGTSGDAAAGNYIVGLDAMTGVEAWRVNTIARPGQPGGESWNGLPLEKRNGASSWVPGSYDAETGLAYFGTAQTYDTGPLLTSADIPGMTNDALYTDSTLAIDPDSGQLVWYFQHLPNDQWDLDWVFERMLMKMNVGGVEKTTVVSAGKAGIYDILNATTGRYIGSVDPGLQNIITAIDPFTGAKTIDPGRLPQPDRTVMVCPHADGAKNWMPGAYNPRERLLFVPLMEICMDLVPLAPGSQGPLSSGVRWTARPRPDSDGNYGRLQAINLQTRELVWAQRQRAPFTSGLLATAGGLVFGGDLDRHISAYDGETGEKLWTLRLNDVAVSSPVSFMIENRQYVAVTVGRGILSAARRSLVPEIRLPAKPAATLWVFELPQGAGN